jgi:hypothetical protein
MQEKLSSILKVFSIVSLNGGKPTPLYAPSYPKPQEMQLRYIPQQQEHTKSLKYGANINFATKSILLMNQAPRGILKTKKLEGRKSRVTIHLTCLT